LARLFVAFFVRYYNYIRIYCGLNLNVWFLKAGAKFGLKFGKSHGESNLTQNRLPKKRKFSSNLTRAAKKQI